MIKLISVVLILCSLSLAQTGEAVKTVSPLITWSCAPDSNDIVYDKLIKQVSNAYNLTQKGRWQIWWPAEFPLSSYTPPESLSIIRRNGYGGVILVYRDRNTLRTELCTRSVTEKDTIYTKHYFQYHGDINMWKEFKKPINVIKKGY